jgi:hypothetical protein
VFHDVKGGGIVFVLFGRLLADAVLHGAAGTPLLGVGNIVDHPSAGEHAGNRATSGLTLAVSGNLSALLGLLSLGRGLILKKRNLTLGTTDSLRAPPKELEIQQPQLFAEVVRYIGMIDRNPLYLRQVVGKLLYGEAHALIVVSRSEKN